MSDYKPHDIIINNKKYKWNDLFDSLYYLHIKNNIDEFKKIYSTASGAKRWDNFTSSKKKELLDLGKVYLDWIKK